MEKTLIRSFSPPDAELKTHVQEVNYGTFSVVKPVREWGERIGHGEKTNFHTVEERLQLIS